MSQSKPLILGMGNPILTDDRVGLEVARALHERLPEGTAEFVEAYLGGVELLNILEGWERVVIIDAVEPGRQEPGELKEIPLEDLASQYAPITPHNAGLVHCLGMGRACGMEMPEDLVVFTIGVLESFVFSESCTEEVAKSIPGNVERIHERLFGPEGRWRLPLDRD